jgi:multiple sugar transport system permease protein
MAYYSLSKPERILTHGVLVAGAIIFSFPFVWMLATSVKLRREMAADDLRLLPLTPRPRATSPYIDPNEFKPTERLDGTPEAVWRAARPQLMAWLGERVDAWEPRTMGPDDNPPPADVDDEVFRREMVEGLAVTLSNRIGDDARRHAVEVERGLRGGQISEAALAASLSEKAIEAGTRAIVEDAKRLVDEDLMRETFDTCYRRFCLGTVRIMTRDYSSLSLFKGDEWRVTHGPATLVERREKASPIQEVRLAFTPEEREATFRFEKPLGIDADQIESVYVGYRGDAAWARVTFEITRAGRLYRCDDWLHLYDRDSVEQELRWPSDDIDPMARKTYLLLSDAGQAPEGSPPFAVEMTVRKTSRPGAWLAKITRNFRAAFREANLVRYIMTSLALAILNIVLAIFSCSFVAYAFARLEWPGRNLCFGMLLATMMIPGQVTMIPGFLVHRWLGWYNTLLPLWVHAGFGAPFFIFLLRQFLKNVPKDLEDAARIDGCGFLRIYWHVMLPLVKPTLATIAIFTLMGVWNNFMGPLIYVNDERLFPLALGMFKFSLRGGTDVGLMMAGSFVMTLPILTVFFFVQRYFIQGVSLTGMKG